VIGEDFAQFVISRTEKRNQDIYVKKDLTVSIDPAVLAAFNSSTLVSSKFISIHLIFVHAILFIQFCLVGKSAKGASLLKVGSKRKRTKREIEEENLKKNSKEQELEEKLANL
jgi:hypothetical protein